MPPVPVKEPKAAIALLAAAALHCLCLIFSVHPHKKQLNKHWVRIFILNKQGDSLPGWPFCHTFKYRCAFTDLLESETIILFFVHLNLFIVFVNFLCSPMWIKQDYLFLLHLIL